MNGFWLTVNAYVDEGANLDPGALGGSSAYLGFRVDVLRKSAWGGTEFKRLVRWMPMYDWMIRAVAKGAIPIGNIPDRDNYMQWQLKVPGSPSHRIEQFDKVRVRVRMFVSGEAQYGPFAQANAHLTLTHFDVELDSY
jgi:hypothetical protein